MRHWQRLARCRLQLLGAKLELHSKRPHQRTECLTIESDPPGADARTSLGPSCRTPCMIPVPADRSFTVSYSLNGYLPQAIQVGPRTVGDVAYDVAGGTPEIYGNVQQAELTPNPVYAQLQPAPPPVPTRKGRGRAKPKPPPQ
jgi:hypothetical protein